MKKSTLFFLLIAISAAVTYYVETRQGDLAPELKTRINEQLDQQAPIKSYVWNYNRLSIGVVPAEVNPAGYAKEVCKLIESQGARDAAVEIEVVDVLKLQQSGGEDWEQIAYVACR